MFAKECLLLMSETLDMLNSTDQIRMFSSLNAVLNQIQKMGTQIIVPNISDNTEEIEANIQYVDVLIVEDRALLKSLGYNRESTYNYQNLDTIKKDIKEKMPYVQRDTIADMFADARKRVKRCIRKMLDDFKMILVFGNPIVTITDKTLKGDYILIRVNNNASVTAEVSGQSIPLSTLNINI